MTEGTAKFFLLQVNDALFPIGGYSHSYGLETYIQKGLVHDEDSAEEFIHKRLEYNFLYNEFLAVMQRNAREEFPAPFGRAEHPRAAQLEKRPPPRPARDRHRPRRAERGQRISTIKARHPDRGPADRSPLRQARKGAAEERDVGPRRAALL